MNGSPSPYRLAAPTASTPCRARPPTRPRWTSATRRADAPPTLPSSPSAATSRAIWADLLQSGGFAIAGPRRSGRSNALAMIARSVRANGCAVLAFCPRVSPLRQLQGEPGVVGIVNGDDPPIDQVLDLLNRVEGPLTVLVDDAPVLYGTAVAELLQKVAAEGIEQCHVLVVAGVAEELMRAQRGFIYQTIQARTGLMLCLEHTTDGDLLGVALPKSSVFRHPPGRAVLVTGTGTETVQVPLAPW